MKNDNANLEAETTYLQTAQDAITNGVSPTEEQVAIGEQYLATDPTFPERAESAFNAGEAAWEKAHPGQVNPATGLGGTQTGDGIPPGLSDDDELGTDPDDNIDPCADDDL